MNERRNLRFHLLRLTNLKTENGLAVKYYKYSHACFSQSRDPPTKYYMKMLRKNVRSLKNLLFRPLKMCM